MWLAFLILGDTPLVRASGLAIVVVGVALSLRRMGASLALVGGITLGFSPAFWSQTGGGEGEPATIIIAILIASVAILGVILVSRRPEIAIAIGIIVFVGLFWSQIGTPQSLRLTGFVVGWLMFLIVDMMMLTNPRPDGAPPRPPLIYQTVGILLLFIIGVINDSLITLLAPAIFLSLLLSYGDFPKWYWALFGAVTLLGGYNLIVNNIAINNSPFMLLAWRDGQRWIELIQVIGNQFSIFGVILGVLGLARLARWYPTLGTVTMVAYAAYVLFGLVYLDNNRDILLLPLYIIQVTWMTYAMFTLGQWFDKTLAIERFGIRILAPLIYSIFPLVMLINLATNSAST